MNRILSILILVTSAAAYSQTSEKYNSEYANFYRAEELFEKEQYGAARFEFRVFLDGFDKPNDPMYIKASFYEAISALELYNNDAITLLQSFNKNYPESIYKKDIYFRLGKYYYHKKDYEEALAWFNKLSVQDIEPEDQEEFYFKIGYANFKEEKFEEARNAFYEVRDGITQYAAPALYYYSHIAYQNKQYETALAGFLKLEDDPNFGKVVPYYIAQIYYLQGKFEEVTEYAAKIASKGSIVNEKDMDHLVGDAFYRVGKYDEAVPYLESYNSTKETTRDEDYRLGYAYYKSGQYAKAIRLFDKVKKVEDSLGQVAYYHIGESLLRMENLVSARSAFEGAAFIDADPVIQEDALYNYAILSYKLDINPYDEAVEAFEMYLTRYPNSERREDVYQYLVNVYMSTNNYAKALASLDKIPNKDVILKTAYQLIAFNQGVERFQKSDYPGAIASFKLVDKFPVDPAISGRAVYWTADANFRLKKMDNAIRGYNDFLMLSSTLAPGLKDEAHYNIGYAYLSKNEKGKAIEAFRTYTQSNPESQQKKADAFMRIADTYYVTKDNEQAVKYYKEALALRAGYEDQALYYMANTYGLMEGEMNNKIKHLLDIVNNYKDSKYLLISIKEIADAYKFQGELEKAMQYYNKIVFDYPASALVVDSKIDIADIYYKQGNLQKAEAEYNKILALHGSDQSTCEKSVRGLIDIYKAMQKPEKVDDLISEYACANITPDEQEDLYYLPAMAVYDEQSYDKAIPLFEKYLEKFTSGRYTNDVKNYLADSYYETGNLDKAVHLYKQTLEGPVTGFTELAASRVAHYLYEQKNYEDVIKYYGLLETVSSTPEVVFNSKLGLMRSHFLIENWSNASEYADKVLANTQINNAIKLEAYYAKGMSNFYLRNYDAAKVALVWVIKNTTTVKAAEARYSLAEIFFKQDYPDEADGEITALLKQKPAYNYWIAKGLILRSRILIVKDDLFQSEQNLKSVLDHYPIPDDGILDEANELWNELMQLKNQPKSVTPESNQIIEINDEGEN